LLNSFFDCLRRTVPFSLSISELQISHAELRPLGLFQT
jgi:hypothetical protein